MRESICLLLGPMPHTMLRISLVVMRIVAAVKAASKVHHTHTLHLEKVVCESVCLVTLRSQVVSAVSPPRERIG